MAMPAYCDSAANGLAGHCHIAAPSTDTISLMPLDSPLPLNLSPSLTPPHDIPDGPRASACEGIFTTIVLILFLTLWFTTIIVIVSTILAFIGLVALELFGANPTNHMFTPAGWASIFLGSTLMGAIIAVVGHAGLVTCVQRKPLKLGEGHPSAYGMLPVVSMFAPALGVAVRAKAVAEVGLTPAEALKLDGMGLGVIVSICGGLALLLFTAHVVLGDGART